MNEIGVVIVPIGFMVAAVIGYLAVKNKWKISEFF
jgi:hypothetical protein